MRKLFQSDRNIPEICPPQLLLPNDHEFLHSLRPRATGNISPIELSWLLFDPERASRMNLSGLRKDLESIATSSEDIAVFHDEMRAYDWGHHNFRVIARVALDPRRYETFQFDQSYRLERGKKFATESEIQYFEHFHKEFGVVERTLPQIIG